MRARKNRQKKARSRTTKTHKKSFAKSDSPVPATGYQCSTCDFLESDREFDPFDPRIPVTKRLNPRKENLWFRCPDAGPENCDLVNPRDGFTFRSRTVIQVKDKIIRLCTPFIVTERTDQRAHFKPALHPSELFQEWILQERRKSGKRPKKLDLADAAEPFFHDAPIFQKNSFWLLVPRRLIKYDKWTRKIHMMGWEDPKIRKLEKEIVLILYPHIAFRDSDQRKATLFIPVDLRQGIKTQLTDHEKTLSKMKEWLYHLTIGRAPSRPKAHSPWRDVYIYFLRQVKRWPVEKIAQEVFPEGKCGVREETVGKILTRVRRALRASPRH